MGLPYQRHQRLNEQQQKRKQISSSGFDFNLLQKPFWIWDKKEHLTLGKESDGHCYWNHIVGLPQKNKKVYPLLDYEKLLYNSLLSTIGSFKRQASLGQEINRSWSYRIYVKNYGLAMHKRRFR